MVSEMAGARHSILIHGFKISYQQWGNPKNAPVLLIHGLAETGTYFWDPFIARFSDAYSIIALDLLGYGESDKPVFGYKPEFLSGIVKHLLLDLGLPPVILIGHSFGGIVAARFAAENGAMIEKLILYATPIPNGAVRNVLFAFEELPLGAFLPVTPLIIPGMGLLLSVVPKRRLIQFALRRWRIPLNPDDLQDTLLREAVKTRWYVLSGCLKHTFLLENMRQNLPRIDRPTLVISGEFDILVTPKTLAQYKRGNPSFIYACISDAGHLALIDQPVEFNRQVGRFMSAG